jgi:mannitol/fructose-specific phosphotransferase system IIA component (Ntr-type)
MSTEGGQARCKPVFLLGLQTQVLHDAIGEVTRAFSGQPGVDSAYLDAIELALQRELAVGPDVLESTVAVVHSTVAAVGPPVAALIRLSETSPADNPGGEPVRFAWVLVSNQPTHPRISFAAEFAKLMREPSFAEAALAAPTPRTLQRVYEEALRRKVELRDTPPGLRFSRRPFGGVLADLRRRIPWWMDDFRVGISAKVFGSTLFMYFACLAPAVAFGGLLYELTGGQIGAVETLLASAVSGLLWALFAGQPLAIVGATGPNVIFTGILYGLCVRYDAPFLETAACTGLWSMLFMWILAATDASVLIRFFSRFTDEVFSVLISLIFIVQALGDIGKGFEEPGVADDTALLTLVLALGTFGVAFALSRFRRYPYLRARVREFFADFGPAIAILAMSALSLYLHRVDLPNLPVPDALAPSVERSWFVNPLGAPRWVWLASAVPALLLTILVWFNQNITARLINSPDNKLVKGPAYHWDIGVMGTLLGLMSLFGLPWVVGAVVRSLNHVRSLDRSGGDVPGMGVLENRVSNLSIHLLLALSLLFLPLLSYIPMAVLFGVFLFMGVGSLGGNQFADRMKLWVMDPEKFPETHYMRAVPLRTIHVFTIVQLICLVVLWVVKSSPIGLAFPFFVAMLIPVRMVLGRRLDAEHIALLDGDAIPDDKVFREVGV